MRQPAIHWSFLMSNEQPASPDCVFDASLVTKTWRDRFVDSIELINTFLGQSDTGHLSTPVLEWNLLLDDGVFLRRYTQGKAGYLFTTRTGRLLDQRNSLKALHGAGKRGGFHAFRRFRFAILRKAGMPENLIKQWMGHSRNLVDLYAAPLRLDVVYRREWCERAGLGFELGELG
jgi:integrase